MTSIDDVLARAGGQGWRRVRTVDLFDPELIAQHEALDAELQATMNDDARNNRQPQAPVIAQRIEELEQQIADSAISFKFGALSFKAWTELLAAHPPTKQQLKQADAKATSWRSRNMLDHNPDTFPQALIAACAMEPEMTVEQAKQLADTLAPDQFQILYEGAVSVNRGAGGDAPKSLVAGAILRPSGLSAATAALEESLAATS